MKVLRLSLLLLLASVVSANAQRPSPPDKLPPNFAGDDPAVLLRQLLDLKKRLVKSELETTAAYESRVVEEKKKPLIGNRTIETTYLLVAHNVDAEYDANTEMMTFSLPVQTNSDAEISRDNIGKQTITDLSRVAKYQVSLGGDTDLHVFFDRAPGLYGSGPNQKFTVTTKLDSKDVKRLKTGAKAVLIANFEEPYATQEPEEGGQFLVRLADVLFFDPRTSIVLGKVSSPQPLSRSTQDQTAPTSGPDYASYRKNPTFKGPRILYKPDPTYTEEARRHNITGAVVLQLLFSEDGGITQIRVIKGLPYGLTERAIAMARQIRFEPAELDGKKVAYPLRVVYRFELF